MATPNYAFNLPVVGGDTGAWGSLLNENWSDLDTDLKAVSDVADAAQTTADDALPKAGGTMTGLLESHSTQYTRESGSGTSGAVTFDLDDGDHFAVSLTGPITISFANLPGDETVIELWINNPSAYAMTWPGTVFWEKSVPHEVSGSLVYGAAPGISSSGGPGYVYIVTLRYDGANYFSSWQRY